MLVNKISIVPSLPMQLFVQIFIPIPAPIRFPFPCFFQLPPNNLHVPESQCIHFAWLATDLMVKAHVFISIWKERSNCISLIGSYSTLYKQSTMALFHANVYAMIIR